MATPGTSPHSQSEATDLSGLKERAAKALQQRQYDLAAGLFRRLSDAEPHDGSHAKRLGDAYIRLGCRRAAVEAYRTAAECYAGANDLQQSIMAYQLVLALQPTDKVSKERLSMLRQLQRLGSGQPAPVLPRSPHADVWEREQSSSHAVLNVEADLLKTSSSASSKLWDG